MPRKGKRAAQLPKITKETWTNPEAVAASLPKRKEAAAVNALASVTPEAANSRTSEPDSEVPSHVHCVPATTVATASNEHGCLNHAARCPVAQEKSAGIQESKATLVVNLSFLMGLVLAK